jgi:hypothetical protein
MAQTNIPSSQKMIMAVFVANVYPMNQLKANFSILERTENTSRMYLYFLTSTSAEKHVEKFTR